MKSRDMLMMSIDETVIYLAGMILKFFVATNFVDIYIYSAKVLMFYF